MSPSAVPKDTKVLQVLEQDLAGKNALVTGASRGIGRAIALHLASRGASIIGTCSSPGSLHHIESLSQAVESAYQASASYPTPKIVGLPANLLSADTPQAMLDAVKREFGGKLDILVNNAAYDEFRPMGQLDAEYVSRSLLGNIQTLVLSVDLLFREAVFQPNSRIINISSEMTRGYVPHHSFGLFASTKAAMESLTRTWADLFGKNPPTAGTAVNSVLVGGTDTEAFGKTIPDEQKKAIIDLIIQKTSLSRFGTAEDAADVVGLLASKRAGWITGAVVSAGGGSEKVL
ncbi:hypothetical protein SLS56_009701 [Neofusicoccum ribis]|uniref:Uncharacterized protein n=1 Tax=Neofusicoccum ribis TaxID=45134 RepID=A0ABR3SHC2_9PEZI